jgi:hypothetical protein
MMIPAIGALPNFVRIHDASDKAIDLGLDPDVLCPMRRKDSMQDFIEIESREIRSLEWNARDTGTPLRNRRGIIILYGWQSMDRYRTHKSRLNCESVTTDI